MAFGAIEALRAEGLAGKIPVVAYDGATQAIEYLKTGELLATVYTNPYWGGGISLALATTPRSESSSRPRSRTSIVSSTVRPSSSRKRTPTRSRRNTSTYSDL